MFFATFVLSTGRCGTQWLAEHFAATYGDQVCVEHEPLHAAYQPRLMLGAGRPERLDPAIARPILAHVDFIEQQLKRSHYLECGHPCWSAIPYLAERFQGRIRVIHLVRHPVPTACSWLTHAAFQRPLLPHLREKVLLSPLDIGVTLDEYSERWAGLNPYEKCLYYWAEVNQFGLDQEKRLGVPWLRLTFESLFSGDGLEQLLAFLELPCRPAIFSARKQPRDQYRYLSMDNGTSLSVAQHPRIARIAEELGYDLALLIDEAGRQRYFGF